MEFVIGLKRYMVNPENKVQNLKNLIDKLRYERAMVQFHKRKGEEIQSWLARAEEKIKKEEETVEELEEERKKRRCLGLCLNFESLHLLNKKAEESAKAVIELIEQAESNKFNNQIKVENFENQDEVDKRNRMIHVEQNEKISDEGAEKVKKVEEDKSENKSLFPKFKSPYQVKNSEEDDAKPTGELIGQQRFNRSLYPADPQEIQSMPIQGYEVFATRKAILEDVMKALQDPDLKIIGLHGMPGVGKTMLVKEVARRAREESMFDEVVMVTVSRNPIIKEIQIKLADAIGLKFDEESMFARAMMLQRWLKKDDKRVLLILDDIWPGQRLELEEVGIPLEGYQNIAREEDLRPLMQNISENAFQKFSAVRFKMLLTSTTEEVLIDMKAERMFELHALTDEEAMLYFQKIVKEPALHRILPRVVRLCAGFPVAISAIGFALRIQGFNSLVKTLESEEKKPIPTKEEKLKSVYLTIVLSYRLLEKPELQSFFQLCALLPQGYDIHVSDMLRFNLGLRIARYVSTLEEARKIVNKLKDAGLLLSSDNDELAKMHDIVRDVSIWIASEERRMIVIEDENHMKELIKSGKLNNCIAISLPYSNIHELPQKLECPRLKLLLLLSKNPSLKVTDTFFQEINELLVLYLTGINFHSLPSSFASLRNLQILYFDGCKLNDIAIIGKLEQLNTLRIHNSDIQRLPREIGKLTLLRLLDLSNCSKLKFIPANILSGLSNLEELLLRNSFDQWDVEDNAKLCELKSLSRLTTLEVHILSAKVMPAKLFSEKLGRYKILIGEVWDWSGKYDKQRMMKVKLTKGIHLDHGVNLLLQKSEDLYLDELKGVKNLLYELNDTGFPQLRNLYVLNCAEMQFIVNSKEVAYHEAFPMLESLFLHHLINLEKICQGKLEEESFKRLKIISVKSCDGMKNLFPFSMTKMLPQLQDINVTNCQNIEEIVTEEREKSTSIATNKIEFPQLRSLTLQLLPELTSFCSKEKSHSIYQREPVNTRSWLLFNEKIVFPVLETLQLSSINIERIWKRKSYCSQNLTSLVIKGCGNLKHLLSPSITRSLLQLKSFEISDCKRIREIIVPEEEEEEKEELAKKKEEKENNAKILFPQLNSLKMKNLGNLVGFCSENYFLELPSLRLLEIENCPQLKEFMHKSLSTDITTVNEAVEINIEKDYHFGLRTLFNSKAAFPNLEKLKISHLKTVKMICNNILLNTDSFSKLKEMKVGYCDELLTIFPSNMLWKFRGLETLIVINCGSLQNIFEILDIKDTYPVATELRELHMFHLPKLKHVWTEDPQGILTFQNIRRVYVRDCWSLKSLFPTSVAKGLQQLEDLTIDCCGLEEVVSEEEGLKEAVNRFVFPQVCSLTLWNLPELKCFHRAVHETEWPKLKRLNTYGFGHEKLLRIEEHESSIKKPLILFEKVIPNLEELSLNSEDISIICYRQFPADFISQIKVLQVLGYHEKPVLFPFFLVQVFNNLEKLQVIYCEFFKEWFNNEGDASEEKLTGEVMSLSNPKWKQNSQLNHVVPDLETSEVCRCDSLISLGSPSAPFHNLTTLDVWHCKAISLITLSTAKNLVQLMKLRIRECIMVREIIAKDRVDAKDVIRFSKLKCLELHYVPTLTSFCPEECTFEFPSLEQIIVRQCPKLKIFCQGDLCTPQLHRVQVAEDDYKGVWAGDLNTTIYQLHKNTVQYYEPEHLKLHEFPELEEIWNKIPHGIMDFKRLKFLELHNCNNLRYIFTSSMVAELVQLQQIKVKGCKLIEDIIRDEEATTEKVIFSQLNSITLKSCLGLACFYLGSFALECTNLKKLTLVDCPKMVAFASTVSKVLDIQLINGGNEMMLGKATPDVSAIPFFNDKVSLPVLKDLTMIDMVNLERIWGDQLEVNSFFNLKHFKVNSCVKLSNIFPLNMMGRLERLKNLQIMDCASLEEIFEPDFPEAEINTKFVFPQVTYLNLFVLPKLKSFCSSIHPIEWPSLRKIDVYGCDKVEIFSLERPSSQESQEQGHLEVPIQQPLFRINKDTFSCLEELRLESNAIMKEIWHGQLPEGFLKVKFLQLINFPAEVTLLPSYFFKSLSNLEFLVVSDAPFIEIFQCEELCGDKKQEMALVQLSRLRLSNLQELTHLWKENYESGAIFCNMRSLEVQDCGKLEILVPSSVSFQNLTTLEVSRCHGLKYLIAYSTAKSLVQLTRISIIDCEILEEVIACSGDEVKEGIVFSQLKSLGLSSLPNLASFCSGNCTFDFPSLETATLRHCPKLQSLSPKRFNAPKLRLRYSTKAGGLEHWEGDHNTAIQLLFMETVEYRAIEYVVLSDSSKLMEIRNWNPQGILDFKNLTFLKVHNCSNLRYTFNPSMAMDLVHLEKLEIHDCEMLEEVIITKGLPKRERMSKKMFPKLVTLLFISLPNLTRFCSGNYLEFPSLKELWIQSCPMLNTFISNSVTRNNSRQNLHSDLTVLFDEKVTFPALEKLGIMDMGNLRQICNDQVFIDSFSKLKVLKLIRLPKQSAILPSCFFLLLSNLERLVVDGASFTDIFQCKEIKENMQAWQLAGPTDIRLSKLPELIHLWKEGFPSRYLRSLKLMECPKLESLVSSTMCFENLTTLEVSRCHGFVNLVTPSTAKSMVQLKRMSITDCKMLEEIIANVRGERKVNIIFKQLEYLRFQSLPALRSFCSGYYQFEFPSLVKLIATECPILRVFTNGEVNTPLLKGVSLTEGDRSLANWDLNATLKGLQSEKARNDVEELHFLEWTLSELWRSSVE